MTKRIDVQAFVEAARHTPVLDVRSPGEYHKGHLPNAISFPLFTNQERAEIGTLYKQHGQQQAFERGLDLVSPKIKTMVVQAQGIAKDNNLLLHCWRGGMRSESVANLLRMTGMQVSVLNGGYKAYRQWVLSVLDRSHDFRVIGGMTGSGKTAVLHEIGKQGQAILDLERIANHRGSAFGTLGLGSRLTQAQFENRLAMDLSNLPPAPVWVEDESRQLGSLILPPLLWKQLQAAPFYYLEVSQPSRIQELIRSYGDFSQMELAEALGKIKRRLGGLRFQRGQSYIKEGEKEQFASLLLEYYDKSYQYSMQDRKSTVRHQLKVEELDPVKLAAELISLEATEM